MIVLLLLWNLWANSGRDLIWWRWEDILDGVHFFCPPYLSDCRPVGGIRANSTALTCRQDYWAPTEEFWTSVLVLRLSSHPVQHLLLCSGRSSSLTDVTLELLSHGFGSPCPCCCSSSSCPPSTPLSPLLRPLTADPSGNRCVPANEQTRCFHD